MLQSGQTSQPSDSTTGHCSKEFFPHKIEQAQSIMHFKQEGTAFHSFINLFIYSYISVPVSVVFRVMGVLEPLFICDTLPVHHSKEHSRIKIYIFAYTMTVAGCPSKLLLCMKKKKESIFMDSEELCI